MESWLSVFVWLGSWSSVGMADNTWEELEHHLHRLTLLWVGELSDAAAVGGHLQEWRLLPVGYPIKGFIDMVLYQIMLLAKWLRCLLQTSNGNKGISITPNVKSWMGEDLSAPTQSDGSPGRLVISQWPYTSLRHGPHGTSWVCQSMVGREWGQS